MFKYLLALITFFFAMVIGFTLILSDSPTSYSHFTMSLGLIAGYILNFLHRIPK